MSRWVQSLYMTTADFCLHTICNELSVVVHKRRKIGIQLGIPLYKLKEIEKEDDPLAAIIDYWLSGNAENADRVSLSWKSIAKVLASPHVDESGLAKRIELKYCSDHGGIDKDGKDQEHHSMTHSFTFTL